MEKTLYIGIDPGKSGFITLFDGIEFDFIAMPEHKIPTGNLLKSGKPQMKKEFNEAGLRDIVFYIYKKYSGYKFVGAIEDVTGRAGWSAQNNFTFGDTTGLQRMILIMLNAKIIKVRPAKWQSFMRQGYDNIKKPSSTGKTMVSDPKAVAEMIVNTEYPYIDFRKTERSKKVDDNKVDSFLICLYVYRTESQGNE